MKNSIFFALALAAPSFAYASCPEETSLLKVIPESQLFLATCGDFELGDSEAHFVREEYDRKGAAEVCLHSSGKVVVFDNPDSGQRVRLVCNQNLRFIYAN